MADRAYAVLELLAWCQRLQVTLIVPLRLDAALFAPAPKSRRGQKGRPRLKAGGCPRWPPVSKTAGIRWQRCWVNWDGRGRNQSRSDHRHRSLYHSGKVPVLIRWVLVRDPLGQFETRGAALHRSEPLGQEIVELFTRRWQVEVTFEETRAHLGIEPSGNGPKAIQRATRSCWDCSRWSRCWRITSSSSLPEHCGHAPARWYAKGHPSFSDALARVRAHLWQRVFACRVNRPTAKNSGGV